MGALEPVDTPMVLGFVVEKLRSGCMIISSGFLGLDQSFLSHLIQQLRLPRPPRLPLPWRRRPRLSSHPHARSSAAPLQPPVAAGDGSSGLQQATAAGDTRQQRGLLLRLSLPAAAAAQRKLSAGGRSSPSDLSVKNRTSVDYLHILLCAGEGTR